MYKKIAYYLMLVASVAAAQFAAPVERLNPQDVPQVSLDDTNQSSSLPDVTSDNNQDSLNHGIEETSGGGSLQALQNLSQQLASLQAQVLKVQNQVEQLQQRQQRRTQAVASLEQQLLVVQQQLQHVTVTQAQSVTAHHVAINTPASARSAAQLSSIELLDCYDEAFLLLKNKKYQKSAGLFGQVITLGGHQSIVADALFWLGEINMLQHDFVAAQGDYGKLLEQFPHYAKVADATFKLALVEQQLGHEQRAKSLLSQVMNRYPESAASQMAQTELDRF